MTNSYAALHYGLGSLSQNNGAILAIASTIILLTTLITLQQSKKLNLLQLGDEEAHYFGLKVKKQNLSCYYLAHF